MYKHMYASRGKNMGLQKDIRKGHRNCLEGGKWWNSISE